MQQFKERVKNPKEGYVIEVDKGKLQTGRMAHASVISSPSQWVLKVRVDENNQLGLYFCSKAGAMEGLHTEGIRKGKQFFYYSTGVYNFQIQENNPVYDTCGIFGFPRNWNYLYGPSKLADINVLKASTESSTVRIKFWIYEANMHSAILHYISNNFDKLILNATPDDLMIFSIKDLYALLESDDLSVDSEDKIFSFVCDYINWHLDENLVDILKAIRLNRLSSKSLNSAIKNAIFRKTPYFITKIYSELDSRSKQ